MTKIEVAVTPKTAEKEKRRKGEKMESDDLWLYIYILHVYIHRYFQEFPNQPKPALYHYLGASSKWIMFEPNIVFNIYLEK